MISHNETNPFAVFATKTTKHFCNIGVLSVFFTHLPYTFVKCQHKSLNWNVKWHKRYGTHCTTVCVRSCGIAKYLNITTGILKRHGTQVSGDSQINAQASQLSWLSLISEMTTPIYIEDSASKGEFDGMSAAQNCAIRYILHTVKSDIDSGMTRDSTIIKCMNIYLAFIFKRIKGR